MIIMKNTTTHDLLYLLSSDDMSAINASIILSSHGFKEITPEQAECIRKPNTAEKLYLKDILSKQIKGKKK